MRRNDKPKLPRLWGEKLIILLIFFITSLFFTNDFGLIDIQKTAIILATSVDKEESGGYNVTAQIAVPQSSKSGGQTSAVAISGKGATVAEAFKEINAKTGWFPKLIFCDLIVLGESVIKENVFDCLGYFLRNEYMSDNCLLAACEGNANELFSAQVPTDNMSALALQKILATEAKEAGNVSTVNLKDFSVGYYAEHKSGYMPYVRILSQSQGEQDTGKGEQSFAPARRATAKDEFIATIQPDVAPALPVAQSGGQAEEKNTQPEEQKIFDVSQTAVFFEGKNVGILDEEKSFAMNLILNHIRQATLQIPLGEKTYALALTDVSPKIEFKINGNTPFLNVSLKASARVNDCNEPRPLQEIVSSRTVPPEILKEAEQILEKNLSALFEVCRAEKCDIFEVLDKLQKFEHGYHNAFKAVVLERVIPSFSVTIKDAS